jgi:cytochrome c oxidase assembly protein Cox11
MTALSYVTKPAALTYIIEFTPQQCLCYTGQSLQHSIIECNPQQCSCFTFTGQTLQPSQPSTMFLSYRANPAAFQQTCLAEAEGAPRGEVRVPREGTEEAELGHRM